MVSFRFITWLDRYRRTAALTAIPLLLLVVAGVYLLVYQTGGIKYVYSHAMYLPILAGGLVFGVTGGIATGLVGGFLLGPIMPMDVASGEAQMTANWLYRLGFFCLIGGFAGASRNAMAWYVRRMKWGLSHDAITGFPNRASLLERLAEMRDAHANDKHSGENNDGAALVMIMALLENADELDTNFGWHATNQVISEMGRRLAALSGIDATVFRHGVNRVCLPLADEPDEAALAERILAIRAKLSEPYRLEAGLSIHADEFIAAVRIERDLENPEEELRMGESALMLARESARRPVITAGAAELSTRENLSLLGQLRNAIDRDQLELHYQPKIEVESGKVVGAEGLIRWNHPELGMIPPLRFIPRAEQSTLIDDITEFAITAALTRTRDWNAHEMDLCLAVNVSGRNLAHPDFGGLVRRQLEEHEIGGRQLELEVTEGALVQNPDDVAEILRHLAGLNVVMSIDDFGTGYSSLQYLADLPVSVIKIDRLFIQRLNRDATTRHIVRATTDLSHRLGMRVVAEGVEDAGTLTILREIGCDMAQGFHVARPMPADAFEKWFDDCGGRFAPAPESG